MKKCLADEILEKMRVKWLKCNSLNYNIASNTPVDLWDTFTGTLLIWDYGAIIEWNYNENIIVM